MRVRKLPSKAMRRALARAQCWTCAICGGALEAVIHLNSVDHVIPLSAGGADAFGNVVLTHKGCNYVKANRMPNGCELVWLLAVNARIGVQPQQWRAV